ncbi:SHOCT domain-containing protein [Leifsonia sp. NPDC058230]|uniref:SHOCT domain-containing protein n=1 Tax=Leifsonia sp. NPDC058230 TaxID=3346391 RepID=UPI0036DA2475
MLSTLAATTAATHWVGPWGGGFGWFFLLIPLFWIAVFVLIFTFAGRRWRRAAAAGGGYGYGRGPSSPSRSAEATLAERFAKGDIDEVEYRARLEVLRANRENQG